MIESFKKQLAKSVYTHGSDWSFDWYIDELFCQAMAFGKNPFILKYPQPIVGDEFLSFPDDKKILDHHQDFFKHPEKINKLIDSQNKIVNSAKNLIDSIKTKNNFSLNKYHKIQFDLSLLMASVSVVFDKLIESEIKVISDEEGISFFDISSFIIDQSSVTALNHSNQRLLEMYRSNKNIKTGDLKQHAQIYGWINTGERGKKPWTPSDFFNQLKALITKKPQATIKKFNLSTSYSLLLQKIIKINQNDNIASDLQVELDFLFQKYLKAQLKDYYNEKIIEQLTFSEITKVLSSPKSTSDYKNRVGNFNRVVFPHQGKATSVYLPLTEFKKIKSSIKSAIQISTKITGSVASHGNVEGVVRLVTKLSDLKQFKKGEILVATQTQPSYTPYMTQALAIITDIGGITSHAAIISREFNIPCIVGTQNATRILKTGDNVRLNTQMGLIEKII